VVGIDTDWDISLMKRDHELRFVDRRQFELLELAFMEKQYNTGIIFNLATFCHEDQNYQGN